MSLDQHSSLALFVTESGASRFNELCSKRPEQRDGQHRRRRRGHAWMLSK